MFNSILENILTFEVRIIEEAISVPMTSVSVLSYIGCFSIGKYYCHQFFPLFFRIQKRKSNFLDTQNTHSNDYTPTCNAVVPAHTFLPPSAGRGFLNDSQEEYIRCSRFVITSSLVGEVYPRKLRNLGTRLYATSITEMNSVAAVLEREIVESIRRFVASNEH